MNAYCVLKYAAVRARERYATFWKGYRKDKIAISLSHFYKMPLYATITNAENYLWSNFISHFFGIRAEMRSYAWIMMPADLTKTLSLDNSRLGDQKGLFCFSLPFSIRLHIWLILLFWSLSVSQHFSKWKRREDISLWTCPWCPEQNKFWE